MHNVTFPCKFMLVASMNPCPCGYYGTERECKCTKERRGKYFEKLSGPILDRIDIQVEMNSIRYESFNSDEEEEKSEVIRNRVIKARKIQQERYKDYGISSNSELTPQLLEKFCKIDEDSRKILAKAINSYKMSARAYTRILKLARTIADLASSEDIKAKHVLEAIQYRIIDKKYGKKEVYDNN